MGPKKGKKGKKNQDEDWGDDEEAKLEEKMKNLMAEPQEEADEEVAAKSKSAKGKKKKKGFMDLEVCG